ncbi:histidine kinase [Gammaproteobacteria bacterium]|nr:histidine kinase [Gammaproteobacteria bacterium]
MSLRVRLSIIVSLLFLTGIILGVSFLLSNAKQRVTDEVESTAYLTFQLLDSLLTDSANTLLTGNKAELLQSLLSIEEARHMSISIEDNLNSIDREQQLQDNIEAPFWFIRLVQSEPLEFQIPLDNSSGETIFIRTNPADEIAEVWQESKRFMLVLFLVLLMLNGILYFTVGHWFKPVNKIVAGLEDVEQGDFSGHVPQTSLPELKVIAEKLNQLTAVLSVSKEENDKLTRRSLTIQEEERRYLAQELHDEMGQSISAINAIAFSISERTKNLDEMSMQGAQNIAEITNHVSGHVRNMMGRLRPQILDELGLMPALEYMVDEWNDYHNGIFCSLKITGDLATLDKHQCINIYRIIQEALTNVARHSQAEKVSITIVKDKKIDITIQDNGCGFDTDHVITGMGLKGIRERVRALNGTMALTGEVDSGVTIEIHCALVN